MSKPVRPSAVTVVAALELIIGIIDLAAGGLDLAVSASVNLAYVEGLSILIIATASVYLTAGWATLEGRRWAWDLGLILAVTGVAISAMGIAFERTGLLGNVQELTGGLLTAAMLYGLTRADMRSFMGRGSRPAELSL